LISTRNCVTSTILQICTNILILWACWGSTTNANFVFTCKSSVTLINTRNCVTSTILQICTNILILWTCWNIIAHANFVFTCKSSVTLISTRNCVTSTILQICTNILILWACWSIITNSIREFVFYISRQCVLANKYRISFKISACRTIFTTGITTTNVGTIIPNHLCVMATFRINSARSISPGFIVGKISFFRFPSKWSSNCTSNKLLRSIAWV